ncbi:MAG: hypothetical protein ABI480_13615 [Chitinophagaceae bacterium]
MRIYHLNSSQNLLDRTGFGLWLTVRYLFSLLLYFPLWLTGYAVTTNLLDQKDSAFSWILLTVMFSVACYVILFFIKGIIIALRYRNNYWWLVFFAIAVSFSCVLPAWLAFGTVQSLVTFFHTGYENQLSWIIIIAALLLFYSRFNWLTDQAPKLANTFYRLGFHLGNKT